MKQAEEKKRKEKKRKEKKRKEERFLKQAALVFERFFFFRSRRGVLLFRNEPFSFLETRKELLFFFLNNSLVLNAKFAEIYAKYARLFCVQRR